LKNRRHRSARSISQDQGIELRRFYPIVFVSGVSCPQALIVEEEEELVLDDGPAEGAGELFVGVVVSYRRGKAYTCVVTTKLVVGIEVRVVVKEYSSAMT